MTTTLISVLLPAFNEGATIQKVIERIEKVLDSRFASYEIVVIADGCTDDTVKKAVETFAKNLRVVSYDRNQGKGHALQVGFSNASGELIVFCDGDLDINPMGILTLMEMLAIHNADVVVGSKTHPNSIVKYPPFRRALSKIFAMIVDAMFDLPIRDTQTGLKVFKRKFLENNLEKVQVKGFAFDLELLVRINQTGIIVEGPIEIEYQFDSRVGFWQPMKMLMDLVRIWFRIRREK
jgi:glycosyltransferase involved in cell wall biosynthesis